jgi:peptidoglycan/LPS O-acetylase OafA/YrhL
LILPNHALFPSHAPLFLLGIVYALWYTKSISASECCITIALAFTSSLIFMPFSFSIVAALTLAVVHFATGYSNRWLAFLGMISYSLYLLHQSTGSAVINFLSHRFREGYQKPIVILIGYMVSIACSFIIYKLIELPSLRLSKSIRYNHCKKSGKQSCLIRYVRFADAINNFYDMLPEPKPGNCNCKRNKLCIGRWLAQETVGA